MSVGETLGGFEPELPWNSPKFREKKDTPWTAGCRWLQSWWREQRGFQPGERTDISETLVGAKFPVDTDAENNFFGPHVIAALEDRVLNGAETGVVPTEVLFRDLLETQVLIFNLLGEFWQQPRALLPWVQSLDTDAVEVSEVRLLWTPEPRRDYLGGGPGFDGFVVYRTRLRRLRFLALVCNYAEDLAASKVAVHERMVAATDASSAWRPGAARRLNRPHLRTFWLATLVAQVVREHDGYDAGRVVSLSCAADRAVALAVNFARADLIDPDWLVASSFDALVDSVEPHMPEWAVWMRTRYLDFTPVLALLDADDPRRGGAPDAVPSDDLRSLIALGRRVTGSRTAFKSVLTQLDNGGADPARVAALEARANDLAADLEAFWEALGALDS